MKIFPYKKLLQLGLVIAVIIPVFVSCDRIITKGNVSSGSNENTANVLSGPVSEQSDFFSENRIEGLEFWILQDVTDLDFSDHVLDFAQLGTSGVYFGKGYDITPTMDLNYTDPYVEYTLNKWPDLSEKRTHITNIRITDPRVRIYGLCLENAAEEWEKVLSREGYSIREDEDLRADVIADSPDCSYTIYYSADPLRIIIDAPITNRDGIVID